MKKKHIFLIILLTLFLGSKLYTKIIEFRIISAFSKVAPNDNFYFIRGLDRDRNLFTGVRYRGILYSDKLEEKESLRGMEIALEDIGNLWKYEENFKMQYDTALAYPRAVAPVKEEARKTFGNDIVVYVYFPMIWDLKAQTEFVENNIGKKTEFMAGANAEIDIFVDDITKVNIDEYKKKLFTLHQHLYNYYNYDVNINIDITPRKYFTYENVEPQIFYLFKNKSEVKKALKKLKQKEILTSEEMGILAKYFVKYFYKSDSTPTIRFQMHQKYVKKYQDINVTLPKEMRDKND